MDYSCQSGKDRAWKTDTETVFILQKRHEIYHWCLSMGSIKEIVSLTELLYL